MSEVEKFEGEVDVPDGQMRVVMHRGHRIYLSPDLPHEEAAAHLAREQARHDVQDGLDDIGLRIDNARRVLEQAALPPIDPRLSAEVRAIVRAEHLRLLQRAAREALRILADPSPSPVDVDRQHLRAGIAWLEQAVPPERP